MPPVQINTLKLDDEIQVFKPSSNVTILLGASHRQSAKMSGLSSELIDLIIIGCTRQDLCDLLKRQAYSEADINRNVDGFLAKLSSSGVLKSDSKTIHSTKWETAKSDFIICNVDGLAKGIVHPLLQIPRVITKGLLCAFATCAIWQIIVTVKWKYLSLFKYDLDWTAILGVVGLVGWVFGHEMSHAIACRYVGCKVSGMGLRIRRYRLPSLFIDARHIHLLDNKYKRACVSFSGPYFDVLFLGALCAAMFHFPQFSSMSAARIMFWGVSYGLFCNLSPNPRRPSDGRRGMGALFGDTRSQQNDLLFKSRKGLASFLYKAWVLLYMIAFMIIIYCGFRLVRRLLGFN